MLVLGSWFLVHASDAPNGATMLKPRAERSVALGYLEYKVRRPERAIRPVHFAPSRQRDLGCGYPLRRSWETTGRFYDRNIKTCDCLFSCPQIFLSYRDCCPFGSVNRRCTSKTMNGYNGPKSVSCPSLWVRERFAKRARAGEEINPYVLTRIVLMS